MKFRNIIDIIPFIFRLVYVFISETKPQEYSGLTDIDYHVFNKAANNVLQHTSPYATDAFRYSPLIAFINVPNHLLMHCFGKILFCACDFAIALLLKRIVTVYCEKRKIAFDKSKLNLAINFLWLLNPFTITISPRGSFDSMVGLIILAMTLSLFTGHYTVSGCLYGLAIHLRVYPIIYVLLIWYFIYRNSEWNLQNGKARSLFTDEFGVFFSMAAISFCLLFGCFYSLYGNAFVEKTYLFHFSRVDLDYNYSIYFYSNYLIHSLSDTNSAAHFLLPIAKVLPFVFQSAAILAISWKFRTQFIEGAFLVTFAFVFLNKVYTAQYFSWWACLLPAAMRGKRVTKAFCAKFFLLLAAILNCCFWANKLEAERLPVFNQLWVSVAVMCLGNFVMFAQFVKDMRQKDGLKRD